MKPGPIPKRGETRIRRNKPTIPLVEGESGARHPGPFEPDERWHPIALLTWESLENSGQSQWFEESDWAQAYFLCEAMNRELKPQFIGFREIPTKWGEDDEGNRVVIESGGSEPMMGVVPIKGASLSAIRAMMGVLLMTEGDRRRMAIELSKTKGDESTADAVATAMREMQDELSQRRTEKAAGK